jgi:hypothetical protein
MKRIIVALLSLLVVSSAAQEKTDWKAAWISEGNCQSVPNTWIAFRKSVSIDDVPEKLLASIATDSKYWLWVNGENVVYEGGLKRGPSPFDSYYDEVDIAPYLKKGNNTVAVLVWHFGKNGFSHNNSGHAALLFEAVAPGVEILSDRTWDCRIYDAFQTAGGPLPNYRLPESSIRFDARRSMPGWERGEGEIKGKSVIHYTHPSAPMGRLYKRPIPLFKNYGLSDYIGKTTSSDGDTIVCRLPYNCHVHPYLKVKASPGRSIQIFTDNAVVAGTPCLRAEYITKDGEQEYENFGWINGHNVYYVIPKGVEVLDLKFRETGYDTEFTGSFECDDPFLNTLWEKSRRTLYITMRDTYMDCPDRERAQWWGDEVNELGEAFYALSPSAQKLALKGIHELVNWQGTDNIIYSPVPAGNWTKELPLQMLASVGWYGFYTQYFFSGDSSFVSSAYNPVHRYLHEVWRLDKNGLPIEREGAWTWGDWGDNIDMGVLTTCWYYLALKAEREFALQLGKTADATRDLEIMNTIEKCFDATYWDGSAYRSPEYKGETDDRTQAMAVVSGLAGKDKYDAIANTLQTARHASPYMEKYVLESLFVMDKPEQALSRMKERYADMVTDSLSTLYEFWDKQGTVNHAWTGGPLTLLSQKVCGIAPMKPGFEVFVVNPQMGGLKRVSAKVDTKYGLIELSLVRSGKKVKANIAVPQGTQAEVTNASGRKITLPAGRHNVTMLSQ